jgi:protein-S-isoprenylcysteine O-methyltransferase Ste14
MPTVSGDRPRWGILFRAGAKAYKLGGMLWFRGFIPSTFYGERPIGGGWWMTGWLAVAAGAAIYAVCLVRFLISGGTPAIFFTRHLKFAIGEEPGRLVDGGLYRRSRNPMYLGVVLAVLGQAILFRSIEVAEYGFALWLMFHLVVVLLEEPHRRRERGAAYEEYCRQVKAD